MSSDADLIRLQQEVIEKQRAAISKMQSGIKTVGDDNQRLAKIVDLMEEYYQKRIYERDWTISLN
ncbi:uncharacterized protein METZ01_LOCUS224860 [marine metagenome]|uniref:Uncharacterized protein n=1 Tax=marine metagenome TaxID=408172 RepID=A0A382G9S9_9ZZZZ|tara:strand:+ start:906 stop:1100 length:195 start_codon:yes stop_codon:yes gene_type:complete